MAETMMRSTRPYLLAELGPDEFASVMGGHWKTRPAEDWRFRGVCFARHQYRSGQTLLARSPGFFYGVELHQMTKSMRRGGVIVPEGAKAPPATSPLLKVENVRDGMIRLARDLHARCTTKIAAITGSVGKTSSVHLLAHLLESAGVSATNGQRNFFDGIVGELTNLAVNDYLVVETSLQALQDGISDILQPDVAVLTHLSPVHVTSNFDMASLADGKARIFEGLKPNGTAVIKREIPCFERVLAAATARSAIVTTFGEHPDADFRLLDYVAERKTVRALVRGEQVEFVLGIPGRHMAVNSLGVLAACEAVGVSWKSVLPRCASARPVQGRGGVETLEIGGRKIHLIDDAYNASPASMAAAFANLAAAPSPARRRIAVLGDMLELGEGSARYHADLLEPLLAADVDKVYLVGEAMKHLWDVLPARSRGAWAPTIEEILPRLAEDLRPEDLILLKGSHDTGLHLLAAQIRFLSFVPTLLSAKDSGLRSFMLARAALRLAAPLTPLAVRRWVSWQLRKLSKAE